MTAHRLLARLRSLASVALAFSLFAVASAQPAISPTEATPGAIQFDTISANPGASAVSLGFAATGVAEIADLVQLEGDSHFLGRIGVALTHNARHSEFPGASPLGFSHPITVTIYAVDRDGANVRPGQVLARKTETYLIPWLAELPASAGQTERVLAVNFDLASFGLALPSEVIVGVAFDTQFSGRHPLGQPGPYDRLGIWLSAAPTQVGRDVDPDALFLQSSADTAAELRSDPRWASFTLALRVQDSAYGVLFETATHLDTLTGPDRFAAQALTLAASTLVLSLDREFWDGNNQLSPYGIEAFDLFADAAHELATVVPQRGAIGAEAHEAIVTIAHVATYLAESAVADALILGGEPEALLRAQAAVDLAAELKVAVQHAEAIATYGEAWEEAQAALR